MSSTLPTLPHTADIYAFNSAEARKKMSEDLGEPELPQKISVCVRNLDIPKQSTEEYRSCLDQAAQNLVSNGFYYDPMVHNCGHYVEKILHACNLSNCTNFPRSNGLFHGEGIQNIRKRLEVRE